MWDLPRPGIPYVPYVGRWMLIHCTTREIPILFLKQYLFSYSFFLSSFLLHQNAIKKMFAFGQDIVQKELDFPWSLWGGGSVSPLGPQQLELMGHSSKETTAQKYSSRDLKSIRVFAWVLNSMLVWGNYEVWGKNCIKGLEGKITGIHIGLRRACNPLARVDRQRELWMSELYTRRIRLCISGTNLSLD